MTVTASERAPEIERASRFQGSAAQALSVARTSTRLLTKDIESVSSSRHDAAPRRAHEGGWLSLRALEESLSPGDLHLDLVVTDPEGHHHLGEVKMHLARRLMRGDGGVLLWGADTAGALGLTLELHPSPRTLSASFSWRMPENPLPVRLLPSLDFMRALDVGNRLRLRFPDGHLDEPGMTVEEPLPKLESALETAIRRLATVQTKTGTPFPLPDELSLDDLRNLEFAHRLLRGETIRGTWSRQRLELTPEAAGALLDASSGTDRFRFEGTGGLTLRIAGHDVHVGTAAERLLDARLEDVADVRTLAEGLDDGFALLVPGDDRTAETVLIDRPGFDPFDRDDAERVRITEGDLPSISSTWSERLAAIDRPAGHAGGKPPT